MSEAFHAVVFRPGAAPLTTLRAKLAQLGVHTDDLRAEKDAQEVAARVKAAARPRDETLVLVVDQFEETFTLARDSAERAVFCAWLVGIAVAPSDPTRVVLTLRDDFLAKVQQERAFEQRLEQGYRASSPPRGLRRCSRTLLEPARRASFAFETAISGRRW